MVVRERAARAPRVGRAERSEQVRAALMAAAREEFLAHGYHGASLDQIAAVAGFTKGVVYSRFASKADLFLALLEERIEARAQQNDRLLTEQAQAGGLPEMARRWNAVQRDDLPWTLLVVEFRVHAARDPELNARYAALHERAVAGVTGVLDRIGVAQGTDARQLAQAILGLGNGLALEQAVDHTALDDERAMAFVARLQGGTP